MIIDENLQSINPQQMMQQAIIEKKSSRITNTDPSTPTEQSSKKDRHQDLFKTGIRAIFEQKTDVYQFKQKKGDLRYKTKLSYTMIYYTDSDSQQMVYKYNLITDQLTINNTMASDEDVVTFYKKMKKVYEDISKKDVEFIQEK